jgi:hypothetical protein
MKLHATEQEIHRSLVQHLRLRAVPSLFWFHCPSGAYFGGKRQGAIMKGLGWIAGIPDLMLIHQSQPLGLELKREGGRLTVEQKHCMAALERAGATCAVAHGLDEAIDQLQGWGLLR